MKRGSSVLQPPSDAAKRLPPHTHTQTHIGEDDARSPQHTAESGPDTHVVEGSSPFPAATSLFSPDVSTKMASDLLIRLSEATQKAQTHPGGQVEAEPQRPRGGQQDEPGLALSPDGPGASPEPPSLTHTPDGNTATDTLASDLLRKLAESQEVNGVMVKEEEESMEVDALALSDRARDRPITESASAPVGKMAGHHVFSIRSEERTLLAIKMEEPFYAGGLQLDCQSGGAAGGALNAMDFPFRVKAEDGRVSGEAASERLSPRTKMEEQLLFRANMAEPQFFSGAKTEERLPAGAQTDQHLFKMEDSLFFGAKMEDQFPSGAKMADQCLRAVLWQDMSVNLASTLLHQLSERVSKSGVSQLAERSTPPIRSSPALKVNMDPPSTSSSPSLTPKEAAYGSPSSLSRNQTTACSYFYRCHVCGFETEGQPLFQGHMTEHRQWERASFSLHCCLCDHSTNQEAAMRLHSDTHVRGETGGGGGGGGGEVRCIVTPPAGAGSAPSVAMVTLLETSTSEHRCRICQRSFPGQQELLVHFQGHRQGNQYRCDRCGHLTRTANKLVEHVRVHTGERPFTCDLCPYSAKRRDSLRLHCKVKHPAHTHAGDVHTHRSYAHADAQRAHKHVQRLHTHAHAHTHSSASSSSLHPSLAGWRDLSPLLPITTLVSLKPRSPSSPSSSSSSSPSSSSSSNKHSFLGYLGLTTSL